MSIWKKKISCENFGEMIAEIVLNQSESFMGVINEFDSLALINKEHLHRAFIALGRIIADEIIEGVGELYGPGFYTAISNGIDPIISPILAKYYGIEESEINRDIVQKTRNKWRDSTIKLKWMRKAGYDTYNLEKDMLVRYVIPLIKAETKVSDDLSNLFSSYYGNTFNLITESKAKIRLAKPKHSSAD